jgi:serine/threonine protein kinase
MHFPKSQAVILIESLVYALRYMHRCEYKHHDIYPTNISYVKGIFKLTNPLLVNASSYALTQQSIQTLIQERGLASWRRS